MSDALGTAHALAAGLADAACWHGDRCTWIGPVMDARTPLRPVPGTLPADLYAGTAGVGLALAEAAAATGDGRLARTAVGAIRQASAILARRPAGGGLHDGATGVALAAARAGRTLGRPELLELARRTARDAPVPDGADLIGGVAGQVLGLLAVARLLPDPGVADRARRLAADLRERDADGPTGLAHGLSGVALALAEAGLTDDAAAVLAREDAWFDATAGNWRDLRTVREIPAASYATAWCHGAPGMVLARARMRALGVAVDPAPLDAGIRTTSRHARAGLTTTGADMTLCHGLGGLAEVLALTGADGGRARTAWADAVARDLADGVPPRCGVPGGHALGLMTGVAGIVHALLRAAGAPVATVLAPGAEPPER